MMISANMLRSAFSFSSATSTGWNKPTTPSPWWWSVTKPFLRASATRWSLRQRERRDVQGQGHEVHFFSWLTAHAKANHHLLFNCLQKEISKPSQAL
jgi:hypothetical protein